MIKQHTCHFCKSETREAKMPIKVDYKLRYICELCVEDWNERMYSKHSSIEMGVDRKPCHKCGNDCLESTINLIEVSNSHTAQYICERCE